MQADEAVHAHCSGLQLVAQCVSAAIANCQPGNTESWQQLMEAKHLSQLTFHGALSVLAGEPAAKAASSSPYRQSQMQWW
jgi:hypothetical protein